VLNIAKLPPIETYIRFLRLRYLGHIERGGNQRMNFQVLHSQLENGARKIGGLCATYRSAVHDDMSLFDIIPETWQMIAVADHGVNWRIAIHNGLKIATVKWIDKERRQREIRKAAELRRFQQQTDANSYSMPTTETVRAPRLERLISKIANADEEVDRRHRPMQPNLIRLQSRNEWFKHRMREGISYEDCVVERRLKNEQFAENMMLNETGARNNHIMNTFDNHQQSQHRVQFSEDTTLLQTVFVAE